MIAADLMSEPGDIVTFETALALLRTLLRDAGWPERILWARAQDVSRAEDGSPTVYLTTEADDPARAAHDYERAQRAGHAPGLSAICTLGDATCALVTSPTEGAAPHISVATPRVEGAARWPLC
jgi:hypothetical protein